MFLRRKPTAVLAIAALALTLTACTGSGSSSSTSASGVDAATATSAEDFGGLDALVEAAKKEGTLNVIALPENWANYGKIIAAITDKTKLIFAETVANPSGEIADIEGLAAVAHAAGIPLIIDSTIATPFLTRPIEWGADIVIHSATKFLGGHGTTLGGVVVESGRFNWHSDKFPLFGEPVPSYGGLQWSGNFGEYAFLTRLRAEQLRDIGPSHRWHRPPAGPHDLRHARHRRLWPVRRTAGTCRCAS